jgi:hypothetical protein
MLLLAVIIMLIGVDRQVKSLVPSNPRTHCEVHPKVVLCLSIGSSVQNCGLKLIVHGYRVVLLT